MAGREWRTVLSTALIAIAATLAGACKGAGAPPATPTAPPTAAPSATALSTSTPLPAEPASFRAFAAELQAALDSRDAAFMDDRIKLQHGTCTEADVQGGIGAAPCTTVGAPWSGFPVGQWRSEGGINEDFDGAAFLRHLFDQALPLESDAYGDGSVRIYALSLSDAMSATIITELIARPSSFAGTGPLRIVRAVAWTEDAGNWKATSVLNASVLAEDFLIPCQAGIDYLGGYWERFPDPNATGGPGPDTCLEGR